MEQPLPSLLFVVKSYKRVNRYKESGAGLILELGSKEGLHPRGK
jgi:hypothetical protein